MPSLSHILTWAFVAGIVVVAVIIGYVLVVRYVPTPAAISPSVSQIDLGQSVSIGVGWTGGSPTYTILLYSTASGQCTTSLTPITEPNIPVPKYVFTVSPTSTTEYCGIVKSASKSSALSRTITVAVNPALGTPGLSLSSTSADFGQTDTLTATVTLKGGSPPYTVALYTGSSSTCSSDTTLVTVTSGSNPITSLAGTTASFSFASPTFASYYCAGVTNGVTETMYSPPVQFGVNPTLSARVAPGSPSVDAGQSLTLTAFASGGSPPYSYQWYSGSTCTNAISGETSSKYSPGSLAAATSFSVMVTDSSMGSPPASVCVKVNAAVNSAFTSSPVVISPPSVVVDAGQSFSLDVSWGSGGTHPYTVQLTSSTSSSCSGAAPIGSNQSGLTGTSTTFLVYASSTTYYCARVTDSATSQEVASSTSGSDVTVNPTLAPTIGLSPQSIDSGQTATLKITVLLNTGTPPYAVTVDSGSSQNCVQDQTAVTASSDDSGPSVAFSVPAPSSETYYCASVTDGSSTPSSATSPAAEFTLSPALTATIAPTSAKVDSGQIASFSVTASSGVAPYTYQWYTGSGCSDAITGQTASKFTTPMLAATTTYSVKVADSSPGTPTSISQQCLDVTVTVTASPVPSISLTPSAIDTGESPTVTADVTWTGGATPFSVTLYSGSSSNCTLDTTKVTVTAPVSNPETGVSASPETFTFPAPTASTYFCSTVKDSAVTPVTSSSPTAEFHVNAALTGLSMVVSPTTLDSGQSETATATVSWSGGTEPYSITLYSGSSSTCSSDTATVSVSSGSNPATGVDANSESFTFPSPGSTTYYCAVVQDSAVGSPMSTSVVVLTVNPPLSVDPLSLSPDVLDSGQSSQVQATVTWSGGSPTYTVTLFSSGSGTCSSPTVVDVISGSNPQTGLTTTTASFTFASPSGSVYYCVSVKDSSAIPETSESNVQEFTVNPQLTAPSISVSQASIDSGQSSTISTATAFSGGTSSYLCQWLQLAPGSSTYSDLGSSFSCTPSSSPSTSTGALTTDGTWYFKLQVTDSSGAPQTLASSPVTVAVTASPAATLSISPSTLDSGQSTAIGVTVSWTGGTAPFTVTLYSGSSSTCSSDTVVVTVTAGPNPHSGVTGSPATFTFNPPSSDTYYCAAVKDGAATPLSASTATIEIIINPTLAAITPVLSQTQLDAGQTVSVTATASWSGGTGPFNVAFYSSSTSTCSSSSTLVTVSSASNPQTGLTGSSATFTFTSPSSTRYYCTVVTDSSTPHVASTSSATTLTVNSPLLSPAISGPSSVDSGQSAFLSTTSGFTGGTSPYICQWLQEAPGASSFTTLASSSSFSCTASSTPATDTSDLTTVGNWRFELEVTDSASTPNSVTSNPVVVTVDSDTTVTSFTISPSSIDQGQTPVTVTAKVSWTGGTPDYSATLYSGSSSTCSSDTLVVSVSVGSNPVTGVTGNTASFNFTSPDDSTYYCVSVSDGAPTPYVTYSSTQEFTVNPPLEGPEASSMKTIGPAYLSSAPIILLSISGVVACAAIAVDGRARSSSKKTLQFKSLPESR